MQLSGRIDALVQPMFRCCSAGAMKGSMSRNIKFAISVFVVVGISTTAVAGDLRITPHVSARETFSDNVDLAPDGKEETALISTVTAGVTIRSDSKNLNGALDVSASVIHQTAGEDEGVRFRLSADQSSSGFATLELIDDQVFVDGSISASRELLSATTSDAESNRETAITYTLSPYLVNHFENFANGELRYAFSQVHVVGEEDRGQADGFSDDTRHRLSYSLDSGRDFTQLLWSFDAMASITDRTEDEDIERGDVSLGVEYLVARQFSVLGSVGYQHFEDGEPSNDVDSPSWDAGFRWRPSRRVALRATYGERHDEESISADLSYQIGAFTTLRASYDEVLETGQERLLRDLSFIDRDPETDLLIDTRTGLPFDPNSVPVSILTTTTRTKTFKAGLSYARGRNSFRIDGTVTDQDEEAGVNDEKVNSIHASFGRQLNRRTNLRVFGTYQDSRIEDEDRDDDEYTIGSSVSYRLGRQATAFGGYTYRMQDSTDPTDEYSENRVTIGARITF
jgi:uncharacterized protein (PEP-CTERM system associated)